MSGRAWAVLPLTRATYHLNARDFADVTQQDDFALEDNVRHAAFPFTLLVGWNEQIILKVVLLNAQLLAPAHGAIVSGATLMRELMKPQSFLRVNWNIAVESPLFGSGKPHPTAGSTSTVSFKQASLVVLSVASASLALLPLVSSLSLVLVALLFSCLALFLLLVFLRWPGSVTFPGGELCAERKQFRKCATCPKPNTQPKHAAHGSYCARAPPSPPLLREPHPLGE